MKCYEEEKFSDILARALKHFEVLRISQTRGLVTINDIYREIQNELWNCFTYFRNNGIRMTINEKSFPRFQDDYEKFIRGEEPNSKIGEPWLQKEESEHYMTSDGYVPIHFTREVDIEDKKDYLEFYTACQYPVDYYKPFPKSDNYIEPRTHYQMYGTGVAGTIEFVKANDGGLFSDDDPVGKTFTMTDYLGLKAKIEIQSEVTEEENAHDNRFVGKYHGCGTIEGYTSERKREIDISPRLGGSIYFYLCVGKDDDDVMDNFPLWEEYNKHQKEWWKKDWEHMVRLMKHIGILVPDDDSRG